MKKTFILLLSFIAIVSTAQEFNKKNLKFKKQFERYCTRPYICGFWNNMLERNQFGPLNAMEEVTVAIFKRPLQSQAVAFANPDTSTVSDVILRRIYENDKDLISFGLIDGYGNIQIKPVYSTYISYIFGNYNNCFTSECTTYYFLGQKLKNGHWKAALFNPENKKITYFPEQNDYCFAFPGCIIFKGSDNKCGLMNENAEIIIKAEYDDYQITQSQCDAPIWLSSDLDKPYFDKNYKYKKRYDDGFYADFSNLHMIKFQSKNKYIYASKFGVICPDFKEPKYEKFNSFILFSDKEGNVQFINKNGVISDETGIENCKKEIEQITKRKSEIFLANLQKKQEVQRQKDVENLSDVYNKFVVGNYKNIAIEYKGVKYVSKGGYNDMLKISTVEKNIVKIDFNINESNYTFDYNKETLKYQLNGNLKVSKALIPLVNSTQTIEGYTLIYNDITTKNQGDIKSVLGYYYPNNDLLYLKIEKVGGIQTIITANR